MDEFTKAYIECALWSTNDESEPLDANYSEDDIHPDTLAQIVDDCWLFQALHQDDICEDNNQSHHHTPAEMAGHDFWLTRNGHGAGFWDGNWKEPAATHLDETAHQFGAFDLYVDDEQIHH